MSCSNRNILNSVCSFTCDRFHTRIGPESSTCVETPDGPRWSHGTPTCEGKLFSSYKVIRDVNLYFCQQRIFANHQEKRSAMALWAAPVRISSIQSVLLRAQSPDMSFTQRVSPPLNVQLPSSGIDVRLAAQVTSFFVTMFKLEITEGNFHRTMSTKRQNGCIRHFRFFVISWTAELASYERFYQRNFSVSETLSRIWLGPRASFRLNKSNRIFCVMCRPIDIISLRVSAWWKSSR